MSDDWTKTVEDVEYEEFGVFFAERRIVQTHNGRRVTLSVTKRSSSIVSKAAARRNLKRKIERDGGWFE